MDVFSPRAPLPGSCCQRLFFTIVVLKPRASLATVGLLPRHATMDVSPWFYSCIMVLFQLKANVHDRIVNIGLIVAPVIVHCIGIIVSCVHGCLSASLYRVTSWIMNGRLKTEASGSRSWIAGRTTQHFTTRHKFGVVCTQKEPLHPFSGRLSRRSAGGLLHKS